MCYLMCCCVSETMGFVDKLFECLSTKNYLGPPAVKEAQKEEVKPVALKSDIVEVHEKPKLCFATVQVSLLH